MKSKWQLFSSVFQIIIGILAICAFVIIAFCGEDIKRWTVTLVLAIAFVVLGIIGIIDYRSNK